MNRRPGDPGLVRDLAAVDLFLGRNLELDGQLVQAEVLYVESLTNWERISGQHHRDWAVLYRQWQTLTCLARVLEQRGQTAESTIFWDRSTALGEFVLTIMPSPNFDSMSESRIGLARLLDQTGDRERARLVLRANLDMLNRVSRQAMTASAEGWRIRTCHDLVQILGSAEPSDDDAWARQAVSLLRAGSRAEHRDSSRTSRAEYDLQRMISERASSQRRSNQLENTRRSVRRMHALGRLLVSASPDCPMAYLAMSEAFRQSAKSAFHTNDFAAVRRHWECALREARHALSLDARDAVAREEVADLEHRLQELVISRKDSNDQMAKSIAVGLGN